MMQKKLDFSGIRLSGKLCANFHSVGVKDTSCTVRRLAKFQLPALASNKTRLNALYILLDKFK